MRVLFDNQLQTVQRHGGASRYFYEMISGLRRLDSFRVEVPRAFSDNILLNSRGSKPSYDGFLSDGRICTLAKRIIRPRLNRFASIRLLKSGRFDIFHPTYYDPYFFRYLHGKPFVLTIFDMIHERFPEYYNASNRTREHKALLARKASKIVAISTFTKNDIVRYLGIAPEKIEVTHLAPSLPRSVAPVPVPKRYVLYVGARGRYKNFESLLFSFALAMRKFPDVRLVCAGFSDFNEREATKISELGLSGKCSVIRANDEQLAFLYEKALCFIYPSLCEGFGIPILEAFSAGCPVLASDNSCFPEIAGDAALYFNPSDIASMADALTIIASDDDVRRELILRGRERSKMYSWQKTVGLTANLYRRCVMIL